MRINQAMPGRLGGSGLRVRPSGIIVPFGSTKPIDDAANHDFLMFAIMGQSNTKSGVGIKPSIDRKINPRIFNIIDTSSGDYPIIHAAEPLDSAGVDDSSLVGFGKAFAEYLLKYEPGYVGNRDILLYLHAIGGTGFIDTTNYHWNKNDGDPLSLYSSGVERILGILAEYPQVYLGGGIPWHQGEDDIAMAQATFDALMDAYWPSWRTDLGVPDLPVVMGGLSPAVPAYNGRTADIARVKDRVPFVGFADPRAGGQSGYPGDTENVALGIADEPDGEPNDDVHFSAATQRTKHALRFLKGWTQALSNNNPGGAPGAVTVPGTIADLAAVSGTNEAALTFTPPANNGGVILGYQAEVDSVVRETGGRKIVGLTNGVEYDIRLRAYNSAGQAAWSNIATVTPGFVFVNAEAETYVNRNTGPALSDGWKAAFDTWVGRVKTSGLWDVADMWQIQANHNDQLMLCDVKVPTRTATVLNPGAFTFVAKQGTSSDGSTSLGRSGFNPGDGGGPYDFLQNMAFVAMGILNDGPTSSGQEFGGTNIRIGVKPSTNAFGGRLNSVGGASTDSGVNTNAAGLYWIVRRTSSALRLYKNDTFIVQRTSTSSAVPNQELYFNGSNGTLTYADPSRIVTDIMAGGAVTDAMIADYHEARLDFLAAIASL